MGTVAGSGPSYLAAGTGGEAGAGQYSGQGARSRLGGWDDPAALVAAGVARAREPRGRVTEKDGCDGGS